MFRSSKHIYAQVIDDTKGETLASASSIEKDLRGSLKTGANIEAAKAVGKLVAERAAAKGVKDVVFDRGGYLYHGRVKALADAAREGGLNSEDMDRNKHHGEREPTRPWPRAPRPGETANSPTSSSTSIVWRRW